MEMSRLHMMPSYRMLDLVVTDRREPMRGAPESAIVDVFLREDGFGCERGAWGSTSARDGAGVRKGDGPGGMEIGAGAGAPEKRETSKD